MPISNATIGTLRHIKDEYEATGRIDPLDYHFPGEAWVEAQDYCATEARHWKEIAKEFDGLVKKRAAARTLENKLKGIKNRCDGGSRMGPLLEDWIDASDRVAARDYCEAQARKGDDPSCNWALMGGKLSILIHESKRADQ